MSLYLVETHQPLLNFFKYFSLNALVEPEEESYEHYEIQTKYFLSLSFIRMNQKLRVRKNVLEPLALQYTFTHIQTQKSYEPGRSVYSPQKKSIQTTTFFITLVISGKINWDCLLAFSAKPSFIDIRAAASAWAWRQVEMPDFVRLIILW